MSNQSLSRLAIEAQARSEALASLRRRGAKREPRPNDLVILRVRGADGQVRQVKMQRAELVRRAQAAAVAKQTVHLAENVHITEAGRRLDLSGQWREVYADPSTDVRIIAPAQRGKTTYNIVKTMAQLSLGMSVGWVMPKQDKVTELVHGKFDGTVRNTPEYADLQESAGGTNSVRFKTFGDNGKLYIVTSNSQSELTSFSADAMHIDERDFCHRGNLAMYPSRMSASPYKHTDEISTPTTKGSLHKQGQIGVDNIHSEFLRGDQMRWHTPCEHCGHLQVLDWYEHVIESHQDDTGRIVDFRIRDETWEDGSPLDIAVVCTKCHKPFNRLNDGRWIPLNPGARVRTRWIEALASIVGDPISVMLEKFARSLGNPSKLQSFHNLDLGRPYSGGLLNFDEDLFLKCVDDDHHMAASCDGPCTIGIDVNCPWLDVQISRWIDGLQVKIWAGKVGAAEEEIVQLCRRFGVCGGVIDHQPEVKLAMKLQEVLRERLGMHLVRCKYATGEQNAPLVISEQGENPELDPPRLITVNRTWAIDSVYETFQINRVRWFAEWRGAIDGDMIEEFKTPVRKLIITPTGNEKFVWDGKPDHQLHAAVYDWLAGDVLGMRAPMDLEDVMPETHQHQHTSTNPLSDWTDEPMILLG